MTERPDDAVLRLLGVRMVAQLGGRLNKHWLVVDRGELMVLRRWAQPADEVAYELRLLAALAGLGWPVAPAVADPLVVAGRTWTLAPYLPGEPLGHHGSPDEQRARGRLLAALHADMGRLPQLGQRGAWRRAEEILADAEHDRIIAAHAAQHPEEAHILRWHLERARARAADIPLHARPGIVVHGDFTPWNLRFVDGRLSGILDFELAHWDHRIGDFALAWRGRYDDVVHGYHEVAPLEPEEWAMLTPLWWAGLVDQACGLLRQGVRDDGWVIKKLLERSPLMGPDAAPFQ